MYKYSIYVDNRDFVVKYRKHYYRINLKCLENVHYNIILLFCVHVIVYDN